MVATPMRLSARPRIRTARNVVPANESACALAVAIVSTCWARRWPAPSEGHAVQITITNAARRDDRMTTGEKGSVRDGQMRSSTPVPVGWMASHERAHHRRVMCKEAEIQDEVSDVAIALTSERLCLLVQFLLSYTRITL